MADVDLVVMGQTDRVFHDHGFAQVDEWERVTAPARRRRMAFDGEHTLAVYIASGSDIDDLIPILVAYQIEWNKLHDLLQSLVAQASLAAFSADSSLSRTAELARALGMTADDLSRLQDAWGKDTIATLKKIARHPKRLAVQLLAGTYINYQRATSDWWFNVRQHVEHVSLQDRPSTSFPATHAAPNLLSGSALREEERIFEFVEKAGDPGLTAEYDYVRVRDELNNKNNFL